MAAGVRGPARQLRLPDRPGLGHRRALRPRSGQAGQDLRPPGRVPGGRGRVRSGLLRHQPARGHDDGPPAAAGAGDRLGGSGGRRHRHGVAARQPDRGLHRCRTPGVRPPSARGPGRPGRLPAHRQRAERGVRSARLHLRLRGAHPDRGHRLLGLPGRPAPGLPGGAARGVHHRAGRRSRGDGAPGRVHRLQPAARPRPGRALQAVRGGRRRDRLGRGRRHPGAGATRRRPTQRPPRPRRDPRIGDQPGWRIERVDRSERAVPTAGDPIGAGRRRPDPHRHRHGRGTRHRHPAR